MDQDKHPKADERRPADGSQRDEKLPENRKDTLDEKLDHAVEETFPASDPVSVKITK